jgi:acyl-[acyl-carrier-protein]-phospholipid O-acyltransferase/long-chain-fatty-acid--[acyl-carrier-protein] ligase
MDDRTNHPHAVADSLKEISKALDAGRLIVIFPEGTLTRSGHMLPFGRGIEMVLKQTTTDVPVIPTATSGLYGGFFSHGGGPILRKLPRAFRPRVGVWFGEPLSKRTDAANVRLAVQESIADLAIRDSDHLVLLHRAFVRNACKFRNLFRPCVIDNSTGPARTLSWGRTLVGALCATRYLKSRLGDAANVGVWLPTGLGGALANLAIAFLHRVSVNLNYTVNSETLNYCIKQCGIRHVIGASFAAIGRARILSDHAGQGDDEHVGFVTAHTIIRTALLANGLGNDG